VIQARPSKPLDGVQVLSFEIQVAGPYCTMMLADQGADVIKVERPGSGDSAREGAPIVENDRGEKRSGYFLRFNRNKRSLTLNLKAEEGRRIFADLLERSDVLVQNFRPGVLDKLGFGYEQVKELNPGLIYASITGFGSMEGFLGPYSDRPAYDIVAQAMGGLMYTCGEEGGAPLWPGVALGDIFSGVLAAQSIILALYERTKTGQGQYIDVSMYDAIVSLAERSITAYSLTRQVLERGREPYIAPWGAFQCKDGYIALIVPTERDWARFCNAIDRPDLIGVEGTTSGPERAQNMDGFLGEIIDEWMQQQTQAEAVEKLLEVGLPVGPVQNASDIFECPHLAARKTLIEVEDPVLGPVKLVGPAAKMSSHLEPITKPAPGLGEDNEDILAQIGYSPGDVEKLKDEGII
jgi:CoA:oxalate CoA-transferase